MQAVHTNVAELIRSGYEKRQAVAIALHNAGLSKSRPKAAGKPPHPKPKY